MLNLNSYLEFKDIAIVETLTRQRFRDSEKFQAPDSLILYEQGFLPSEDIIKLCRIKYEDETIDEPTPSFVPESVVSYFMGTNLVPINYNAQRNEVTVLKIHDLDHKLLEGAVRLYTSNIVIVNTTPSYFFTMYNNKYGVHPELAQLPAKELFEGIKQEAINMGASDITITTRGRMAEVYYNIRKTQVYSKRSISAKDLDDIITIVTIKSPMDMVSRKAKYVDIVLTENYRGRVIINKTYRGHVVTIRLLPQSYLTAELEELNLTSGIIDFIRKGVLDTRNGLRLVCGATMSGKNTTCLATLKSVVTSKKFKVVSVEKPVEQEIFGVEQIHCEDDEEFRDNIRTLIHQNPDFVYVAEIIDVTGTDTVHVTNTGKRVLSTIHVNSAYDIVTRLTDITDLSPDRVIQTLHSVIYQELVRDDETDTVVPRCKYIEFTDELKYRLYGKGLGEISRILKEVESGDEWMSSTSIPL